MSRKQTVPTPPIFQTLFEAQTKRTPTALAVLDAASGAKITYRQLSYRANRLARHLIDDAGIGPERAVGVCLERSLDLVIAAIAVLKAGGVYVPLDPRLPAERLAWAATDARLATVLTHRVHLEKLTAAGLPEERAVALDADRATLGRRHANPPVAVVPENAAYTIYTSGTTGRPKGVVIPHRGLGWYAASGGERFGLRRGDRILQLAPISFDVSVAEIFPALARGATVVLRDEEMIGSVPAFFERCAELEITVLFPSTAFWHELARGVADDPGAVPEGLRLIGLGTERLSGERVADWRRAVGTRIELRNLYGPTEGTVDATSHDLAAELAGDGAADPPIGLAVDGVRTEVVDRDLQSVAEGAEGELAIASVGLARGYLGNPAATAQRFVPDPFAGEPGARLYLTGDLVRERGELEFVGRRDRQVKIRGFRVEPGEIEAALAGHPAVREAAVLAPTGADGTRRLDAFFAAGESVEPAELRSFLAERLPRHMVPSSFTALEELPKTPSAKLDYAALREAPAGPALPFAAPRSDVEEALARIWRQVLRLERVGVHDDFFELGGDSILGIRIVSRAHQEGFPLLARHVFENPTIAELAQLVGPALSGEPAISATAEQGEVRGDVVLTPIQRWFFERHLPEPWHFNWTGLYRAREPVDPTLLEAAFAHLLRHHDALRLRFTEDAGRWRAVQGSLSPVPFTLVDLTALDKEGCGVLVERAAARLQTSLDLGRGPLVRAACFALADTTPRFFLTAHHLVVDGVSWDVLFEDLERAYRRLAAGHRRVALPPKTASFKRWAELLAERATCEGVRGELGYWRAALSPWTLLLDHPQRANTVASTELVSAALDAARTELLLRRVPAAYHTRIDDVLLTALARAFRRWTGDGVVAVELEGHGREEEAAGAAGLDLARTVGWFTAFYPVRLEIGTGDDPGGELKAVKETLRQVPRRGLGYGLLRYLSASEESGLLRTLPRPQVSFNYLGQLDESFAGAALFAPGDESPGPRQSLRGRRTQAIEITGRAAGGELRFEWRYSRNLHRRATVESLAAGFVEELATLVAHCLSAAAGGYTPSDFPLAGLGQDEIDRWLGGDRDVEDVYPLTPIQEGMLFHALYDRRSTVYLEQTSWELCGELDPEAFAGAFARLVERHAVLRATVRWEGLHRPLQIVRRTVEPAFSTGDWRGLGPAEQAERLAAFLADDRRQGFDLSRPPLLRASLLRLGERVWRFTWTLHHVLLDGWSLSLLNEELFATYEALRRDRPPERPRPRPFRGYVAWLAARDPEPARRFWRRQLADFSSPTPLVFCRGRTGSGGSSAAASFSSSSLPTAQALADLVRGRRLTLATAVQGMWAVYLGRTSRRRDVVFGTTSSGRPESLPGAETMVGLLIQMVPVRVEVDPEAAALPFLDKLQAFHAEARQHGDLPLAEIQGLSGVSGDRPLFESLVGFHNYPGVDELLERHGELVSSDLRYFSQTSYPLVVEVVPGGSRGLGLRARYDPARIDACTAGRTLRSFFALLEGLADDAGRRLGELPLLSAAERHQTLVEWSAAPPAESRPAADWDETACLHELFEAQAAKTPDAPALVYRGKTTSYRELDHRAGELARELRELGVGPEVRVVLCLERTPEAIVAILGVQKAGGAYVPLDPRQPERRLAGILEDCRPGVVIGAPSGPLSPGKGAELWLKRWPPNADRGRVGVRGPSQPKAPHTSSPAHLAYVIYTSGSTGRPKGVAVEHRQVVGYLRALSARLGLPGPGGGAELSFALAQPLAFDATVGVVFPALLTGAALHLLGRDEADDPGYLASYLDGCAVDFLKLTPTHLEALENAAGRRLLPRRWLVLGGEAARRGWAEALAADKPPCHVFHSYGPTEATVGAALFRIDAATLLSSAASLPPGDAPGVPVGRPLGNVRAVVVDELLRPLPSGVPGELVLGGACLARGYSGDPAATAAAFVPDPFGSRPGGRLYRTGDLGRALGDGNLEHLRRLDRQLKIRGHRVEAGEAEAALAAHPELGRVLVLPRRGELVAWVVPAPGARERELLPRLQAYLRERLPDPMLPAVVVLDEMPLLASGKVDRGALPAPGAVPATGEEDFLAPRDETEKTLAEIWGQVLGIADGGVGVYDDFFALGGDSILSLRVVARAREKGLELTPRDVFERRSVAALAEAARERRARATALPPQEPVTGTVPLTPIQLRFFERRLPEPWHFNWSALVEARRPLDPALLQKALAGLLRHHDALRLRFARTPAGWQQWNAAPDGEIPFHRSELSPAGRDRLDPLIERVQASLRLREGPLLRLVFFDRGRKRPSTLLFVVHHLAIDGLSWPILFGDLERAYRQLEAGRPVALPAKTTSYRDWARGLREEARSAETLRELELWELQTVDLAGLPTEPRPDGPVNDLASAETVTAELDAATTARLLREAHAAYRTTIDEVLLTALARAVGRWSGRRELAVELEGHGREDVVAGADLSRTVGWFTSTYPVVLRLPASSATGEALLAVKETLRRIPRRGIGYGLLRYLGDDACRKRLAALPRPEVLWNYLGTLTEPLPGKSLFRTLDEPASRSRHGQRVHLFELTAGIVGGRFRVEWTFSRAFHRRATVERLAASYLEELRGVVVHCLAPRSLAPRSLAPRSLAPGAGALSPADFPLAGLDARALSEIAGEDPANVEDVYPLSPMQEGMLYHALLTPETPVYVEQASWELDAGTDAGALRQAWQLLVERHTVFRTSFHVPAGKPPVQVVRRRIKLPWEEAELGSPGDLASFLAADRRRGLDLGEAPVMRLTLLGRGDAAPRFVWTCHHLLKDGWSGARVLGELARLYYAARRGAKADLPRARPYRDFIAWLSRRDMAAEERYWRGALDGFAAATPLPFDHEPYDHDGPAPPAGEPRDGEPHEVSYVLSAAASARITDFARRQGLTANTVAQGAWALQLARSAGECDVVFGATVAGRPAELADAERRVGCFLNTLPVRARLSLQEGAAGFLRRLQDEQAAAREHQHSPLVRVREWSAVEAPRPLFGSILAFESYPEGEPTVRPEHGFSHTGYPLTVIVEPGRRLALHALYEPSRFLRTTATALLHRFAALLAGIPEDDGRRRLGEIPLLGAAERHQVVWEHNDVPELGRHATVVEAFGSQSTRTPDAAAVVDGGESVSYRELERRSRRLALRLLGRGAGPGAAVGIAAGRSIDMVVGVLAVLRAGAAYVPLDPEFPPARLAAMAAAASLRFVLAQTSLWDRVEKWAAATPIVPLETPAGDQETYGELPRPRDEDLAYVMFTSGSTGRPKGVAMPHRALSNLVAWFRDSLRPGARTLGYASLSFDASFSEIFSTLTTGGTLFVVGEETRHDAAALYRYLRAERIEQAIFPVVVLQRLAEEHLARGCGARGGGPLALREVVATGEQLHVTPAVARFFDEHPSAGLHNHYGPAETHVVTSLQLRAPPWPSRPSIGRPIPGTSVRLVGPGGLDPAGIGAAGEILIGGAAVARGYAGRPRATAERFLPDPWSAAPGGRIYRTGDLGRRRRDGEIDFLGRIDHQVKVRGFRVEPGEVEAALAHHPEVREVAVVARSPEGVAESAGTTLAAYFVAGDPPPEPAALAAFLTRQLPEYMIPASFVALDELPLSPTRKVDRGALARRPVPAPPAEDAAERSAVEEVLAGIWSQVLGRTHVGTQTPFFALGGHSLTAVQVMSRVREIFEVELAVRLLFERPTVAELAATIEAELAAKTPAAGSPAAGSPAAPLARRRGKADEHPLSFAQERLWFLQTLEPDNPAYNLPIALSLSGPLDEEALESALAEIVRRHEALRTVFPSRDGRPRQVILPPSSSPLPFVDLTGLSPARREAETRRLARHAAFRSFDLVSGPLFQSALLARGDGDYALLLVFHHLVFDAWSEAVFHRELAELYAIFSTGRISMLPEPTLQYADFASWQRERLTGVFLENQLTYWKTRLGGELPVLEVPADRPRPARRSYRGTRCPIAFAAGSGARLAELGQGAGTSLFMTANAAVMAWLHRLTGQGDVVIGTPVAQRDRRELEELIGLLTNTLVLRGDLHDDPIFRDLLARARESALAAFSHQELPFERLVEELRRSSHADLGRNPLFEVIFTLDNTPPVERHLTGLSVSSFEADAPDAALPGVAGRRFAARVRFDLEIYLWEDGGELRGSLYGRRDLFDDTTLARLAQGFATLVRGAVLDPGRRLSQIPLLSPAERHQLVAEWNDPGLAEDGGERLLHELFAAQAARQPRAAALVGEDGTSLSYGELERRANRLALRLRGHGVGPETRVGLALERSAELLVGILGILKAGGTYVPLDPAYPRKRLARMAEDARLSVLVSDSRLEGRGGELRPPGVQRVRIDALELTSGAAGAPRSLVLPDHLAYVIYTSGSTGRPKGTAVTHKNATRLLAATKKLFRFSERDVWTLFHSFAFDFSVWEMWGALAFGGRLVVVSAETARSPEAFAELLERRRVTVLNQTPSAFRELVRVLAEPPPDLRLILCGGEVLELAAIAPWLAHSAEVGNMYGITETTIHVTHRRLDGDDTDHGGSPVGRPLAGATAHVLDRRFGPMPVGVPGELFVAGEGLARGYLGRPGLTAQSFLPNPFGPPGSRLYRTGDRVRRTADGELRYLGRMDEQLKLRGFRIEPGEVEAVLAEHPAVTSVAVVSRAFGKKTPGTDGDRQLVAYLVPDADTARPLKRLLAVAGSEEEKNLYRAGPEIVFFHRNRGESEFLVREIFEHRSYLRHGITLGHGDVVFDAGANIGLFSLFAARQAEGVKIYAFEPVPRAFETLEKNVHLWGLDDAQLFACALGAASGTTTELLYYPHASILSGRASDPQTVHRTVRAFLLASADLPDVAAVEELLAERLRPERLRVPVRTLSGVIHRAGVQRVDLLKIDVEGSEAEVLAGIAEGDWPKIRQLTIEVHDRAAEGEIVAQLRQRGYEVATEVSAELHATELVNVYARRPGKVLPREAGAPAWWTVPALTDDVRRHLRERLPEFMLPAHLVLLAELPATPSGKVDRAALSRRPLAPAGPGEGGKAPDRVPRSPIEEILTGIWSLILDLTTVPADASFFDLGGHSLNATQAISRIRRELGVELPLYRFFERPTIRDLAAEVERIRGAENLPVPPEGAGAGGTAAALEAAPRDGALPLSTAQERLWLVERIAPGHPTYHLPAAWDTAGPLDAAVLEASLREILRRHESLRTTFPQTAGRPRQEIAPVSFHLALVDLSGLPAARRPNVARALARREAARLFDLARGPLFRTFALRLAPERHVIFHVTHHIVSDGWSLAIFHRELAALYRAGRGGEPSPLPELQLQYADFAVAERRRLAGTFLAELLAWWRERLEGLHECELPSDRPRTPRPVTRGARLRLELPALPALRELARGSGATLFMVLLAAFKALLRRLTGQDDLVVGSPIANRNRAELEEMIGFFVNTLVLRTDLAGDPPFAEILRRLRETALDAFTHQELPFERLVEELDPERDPSRNPLFQILFTFHNTPWENPALEGLQLTPWTGLVDVAACDLEVVWTEDGEALYGELIYDRDLFDATRMARLGAHLRTLTTAVAEDPGRKLSRLPLLAPAERHQLLREHNDTAAELDDDVVGLFLAQVHRAPEAVATSDGRSRRTYAQLAGEAGRAGRTLAAQGIATDDVVALLAERDNDFLTAVLAVFMAGGACLPLDPSQPPQRLARILELCGARLVLAGRGLEELAAAAGQALPAVPLPELLGEPIAAPTSEGPPPELPDAPSDEVPDTLFRRRLLPDQLACVQWTAGSGGFPRRSLFSHRALASHLRSRVRTLGLSPSDVVAQTASKSFEVSIAQLLTPLLGGARLEILRPEVVHDEVRLLDALEAARVTVLETMPLVLRYAIDEVRRRGGTPPGGVPPTLRWLLPAGEVLPSELARAWRDACPGVRIANAYGPAEGLGAVCQGIVDPGGLAARPSVPIGRPAAGPRLHLLDERGKPVPIGVAGEIALAGDGVGRGFLDEPRATAEAFVPDPWSERGGERLFRTGDLAVRLADGSLGFDGRIEHRLELRGRRIEPREIEAALERHPTVRTAAVVLARAEDGEPSPQGTRPETLVAWVEPRSGGVDAAELRRHLLDELPASRVPARIFSQPALPTTPDGRIDRGTLARRPLPQTRDETAAEPRSRSERELALILADLLGRGVGLHDDFFELGGHSLLAVRYLTQIEQRLGARLPLAVLFREPTVAALARQVGEVQPRRDWSPLVAIREPARPERKPFFCVHPSGGGVLCYRELARHLGDDQPFYGLEARGLERGTGFHRSVGEMAAAYVEAIREVQDEGPYRLGGWSDGGVIAYEMARKLQAAGAEVALVVLMDSAFPDPQAEAGDADQGAAAGEGHEHLQRLARHLAEAVRRYLPRPYSGQLTLLRPEAWRGNPGLVAGWIDLVRHLEVCLVPGDHETMVGEPHVRELAARLRQRLG